MAKYRVDLISNGMEEDGSEKAELWRERQRKGEAMGGGARACEGSDQLGGVQQRQSIGKIRGEKARQRSDTRRLRWAAPWAERQRQGDGTRGKG